MANLREKAAIEKVINYTNVRIRNWYRTVKKDHDVDGSGKAFYNEAENKVVVEYTENGEAKTWEMAFYPEYLSSGLGYIFHCWGSLA